MYIYTGSASPPEMRGSQKGTDVAKNAKKKNGLRRKTGIRAFNRGREWKKKKTLQNEHARWNVFFFVAVSIKLCRKANSHTKEKRKLLKWGRVGGGGQGKVFVSKLNSGEDKNQTGTKESFTASYTVCLRFFFSASFVRLSSCRLLHKDKASNNCARRSSGIRRRRRVRSAAHFFFFLIHIPVTKLKRARKQRRRDATTRTAQRRPAASEC